ncbi:MAG: protein phosphatase CheZ [Desulfobacteraceae bacterium]
MQNVIMGNLDGELEKVAFDPSGVRRILDRSGANIVLSGEGSLYLELDGDVYPVTYQGDHRVHSYFIVLADSEAFNVSDYRMLFEVRELPNHLVAGTDSAGRIHLCRRHKGPEAPAECDEEEPELCLEQMEERLESREIKEEELDQLRNMVRNIRNGKFFESLTSEFSSKIKEIALELIDFRKDIKQRIEPGIVDIAARDIPEASNQLEGINETLESTTMKIMDINEEQMELAKEALNRLQSMIEKEIQWEKEPGLIREMKGLLEGLTGETRQVVEFVLPGLESALKLMERGGGFDRVKEDLAEPMATIQDLERDLGEGHEETQRLAELNRELEEMLETARDGEACELTPEALSTELRNQTDTLERIADLSMKMMEPLSFQDLVGQRIQRIIKLVKSMEERIEDLIISFGIKLQKYKEDPSKSFEELNREVEHYKSELKGPQGDGGLDQKDIDDLLASL